MKMKIQLDRENTLAVDILDTVRMQATEAGRYLDRLAAIIATAVTVHEATRSAVRRPQGRRAAGKQGVRDARHLIKTQVAELNRSFAGTE